MDARASARGFWLTVAGSAVGYPVIVLILIGAADQDDNWLWPSLLAITAASAACGIAISATRRWRNVGLGLVLGVALGVVIAVVVVVIALSSLASEIGYS